MSAIFLVFWWICLSLGCIQRPLIDRIYKVSAPGLGWERVAKSGGADRAWLHKTTNGIIYVDANCGRQFEDRNLKDSLYSLTHGIVHGEILAEEELIIANRKGLLQVKEGVIDGVAVWVGALIVSKNNCLFDFLLVSSPETFHQGVHGFLNTVQSLQIPIER